MFAASLFARLTGLATIYATGLLLSKNDFALYAIALAWGEIFGYMQNGGLHRLLMQRAKSFDQLYGPLFCLALTINGFWLLLLLVLAPLVAHSYEAEEIMLLMVLFGLSIPAGTVALLLRAYLLVNLRFVDLSLLNVYSTLIRNGGIISLAIAGFGPASFMLSFIAVSLFESVYLSRKRPGSWRPTLPRRRVLRVVARPLLWLLASGLALSLTMNGDYIVIGAWTEKAVVGAYFFGFQLTVAALAMFTVSLRAVLVPSFVALGNDWSQQENAFLRSLEAGSLLLFFVMFAVAAVAEPAVGWIWSGKWDAAVPVIEIMAVASLSRVVSPLALSLLEARGAWRLVALMTWTQGLGLMFSAAIGVFLGGLIEIAMSVGVFMTLFGLLHILVICRQTAFSILVLGKSVLGPYAIAGGALALAWLGASVMEPTPNAIVDVLLRGTSFVAAFAVLTALFGRSLVATAANTIRTLRNKGDLGPSD